jgi:glyoxylase-like metal-dependent hydrolase (beta-lactamase superfamily II)
VRAVSLHSDVIVVTSALLQVNCVIVRGGAGEGEQSGAGAAPEGGGVGGEHAAAGETFVIDSPVLPDELDALPSLIEQARFPTPSGLLATHADWDHLLGRLSFPGLALGVAESTAARLAAHPGAAQRELRDFDEGLMIERARPLALGSVQALPVPGRCEIGDRELELHPASGHTRDGMAVLVPWARVLVAGDYLSPVEIPMLSAGGAVEAYVATLERLRPLVEAAERVVSGHGPVVDARRALSLLDEDVAYLSALARAGERTAPPTSRRGPRQQRVHADNVRAVLAHRQGTAPE